KLDIFRRQGRDDLAVLPLDFERTLASILGGDSPRPAAGVTAIRAAVPGAARRVEFGWGPSAAMFERDGELWWPSRPLIALGELRLRGRHNVENAMAAAAVCLARGLEI